MNWTETRELLIAAGIAAAGLPTQWLPAINLSGANLSWANLRGANLHGANLHEVAAMIDIGVPPSTALVAATRGGAALLGHHDRGTVAPGQVADFVLFDRDPSLPGVLRDRGAVVAVALAGRLVHAR